jgi:glutathione synthase/RimK-type ligase-like ATP-grasp enzyme
MAKKVLLLFSEVGVARGGADPQALAELLHKANSQLTVNTCMLEDLLYLLDGDKADVIDTTNECSLTSYDSVYFRYWGQTQGHAIAAARFCKLKGIPFVDTEVLRVGSQNKITQYMNLYEAKVPIPRTLIGKSAQLTARHAQYGFAFPLVLKAIGGTRGRDNYLARDASQMQQIFSDNPEIIFVMQGFIPNDRDYRVIVMGDKVVAVIERKASGDTHLNNTSQGGSAAMVPIDTLPAAVLAQSVHAAQFFGRQIAGVDMVKSLADGNYYCFEVNRAPQIEQATYPEEKAALLAGYLSSL